MTLRPFHLAFPVDNLAAARAFYGGVLGCPVSAYLEYELSGAGAAASVAVTTTQSGAPITYD